MEKELRDVGNGKKKHARKKDRRKPFITKTAPETGQMAQLGKGQIWLRGGPEEQGKKNQIKEGGSWGCEGSLPIPSFIVKGRSLPARGGGGQK